MLETKMKTMVLGGIDPLDLLEVAEKLGIEQLRLNLRKTELSAITICVLFT